MKTLDPILSAYAEQNGISIMVEKKSIVVGKNEFDVSTAIIGELDKQLSSITKQLSSITTIIVYN